ncbi:MAG: type I-E CRISPR-associated protein Cse2/CasB [Chloroflexota bacterium]
MKDPNIHPFIFYLQGLAQREDRGILATLRRGLGQDPSTSVDMFRYVEPFNPPSKISWVYYLVAALFSFHPMSAGSGNFGMQMRACDPKGENSDALDRRFSILLAANQEDLPAYLRQSVAFLKSRDIPINWNQLFWDLQKWDDDDRHVQKNWAGSFWNTSHVDQDNAL